MSFGEFMLEVTRAPLGAGRQALSRCSGAAGAVGGVAARELPFSPERWEAGF